VTEPSSDRAMKALQLRHEIQKFLDNCVADRESIAGGGGLGSEDITLTVGGEPFHIQIHWAKPGQEDI
jgi:hypothetical protein